MSCFQVFIVYVIRQAKRRVRRERTTANLEVLVLRRVYPATRDTSATELEMLSQMVSLYLLHLFFENQIIVISFKIMV